MDHNELITKNLRYYDTIKPKNPDNSYTVLATLNDFTTGKLLALATGTQANLRSHPNDIEDCHAESLIKRAYKRYLIDNIAHIIARRAGSKDIDQFIRQECNQNLILFVTQFPCGLIRRYEGDEPIDENGDIISRKPGRGTIKGGKVVYVGKDSCLIKLNSWVKDGLQGKKLGELFDIRSSIKSVIVGNCEPNDELDYKTSAGSLEKYLHLDDGPKFQLINHVRRDEFVYRADKQPHPVALVWWSSYSDLSDAYIHPKRHKICHEGSFEFIVDGRKRGLTKKQYLKGIPADYLKISNHVLSRDLGEIEQSYCLAKSGD